MNEEVRNSIEFPGKKPYTGEEILLHGNENDQIQRSWKGWELKERQ